MTQSKNCFRLLDLDPSTSRRSDILKRIEEKRSEWSRKASGTRPDAIRHRALLNKLDHISSVLLDENMRSAEAAAYFAEVEADKFASKSALDSHIELLRVSLFFTAADVLSSAKSLKLSPGEVEAAFLQAGLKKGEKQKPERKKRFRLDGVDADAIDESLAVLGLGNLYDFMGLGPETSLPDLRARVVSLDKLHRSNKSDAVSVARQTLSGQCRQVFQSESEKDKYDHELYIRRFDKIKALIDLAGTDNLINHVEFLKLVELARGCGVDDKAARDYVLDYAADKGWMVVTEEELGGSGSKSKGDGAGRELDWTALFSKLNLSAWTTLSEAERNRIINIAGAVAAILFVLFLVSECLSRGDGRRPFITTGTGGPDQAAAPAMFNVQNYSSTKTFIVRPGEGAFSINLRSGPGRDYVSVRTLQEGEQVTVTGEIMGPDNLPWLAVQAGGDSGFVKASLLRDPTAPSPSFDCSRATEWSEMMVCSRSALAQADVSVAEAYNRNLGRTDGAGAADLRRSQLAWIAERNQCQTSTDPMGCLTGVYASRSNVLVTWSPPAATASAEAPTATEPTRSVRTLRGRASMTGVDRLTVDGRPIRLHGVRRGSVSGYSALARLVNAGQPLLCTMVRGDSYRCVTANGVDVAETAVLNGLVHASGPDYRQEEADARSMGIGIWVGDSP